MKYIGAIDQGTTSTRFIVFDRSGTIRAVSRKEHDQICPEPGWAEHDPVQIWKNTCQVIEQGLEMAGISGKHLDAVGVTNQRETLLAWDKNTGKPCFNAIVWQCTRTRDICDRLAEEYGQKWFKNLTGLPAAAYFSGPKMKWLMDNVAEVKAGVDRQNVIFGTIDTWLVWNLTGGPGKGMHVTDITNAGRTLLMNIEKLEWDEDLLSAMGIPGHALPDIVSSSSSTAFGTTLKTGPFKAAVPIGGALGDQQAALFGQTCFDPGEAKNTYGTGCFFLMNTGEKPEFSDQGLLTTPAYRIENKKPCYALEGSVAYAGALVQWARDNLGLISSAGEIEELAARAEDNGGVYFVPAFSGLFAPYWRPDARGIIAGLTRFADKTHIARAVLEACAFQTMDIVRAIEKESGRDRCLKHLKVDGGMVENRLLMQFQADILNVEVIRPQVAETTALGAAYAAGLATGVWSGFADLKKNWSVHSRYIPEKNTAWRTDLVRGWEKAVQRTLDWI
jgi:glycerol kinase